MGINNKYENVKKISISVEGFYLRNKDLKSQQYKYLIYVCL